jgi:putative FmdB family regulatory protein
MPLYEFKCEKCSQIEEHLMKISDPAPNNCEACGGKLNKIMSQTSFTLKGTGWYATDYKTPSASSSKGGGETTPPAAEKSTTTESAAVSTPTESTPSSSK